MAKTNGAMDFGTALITGKKIEMKGYVVPTVTAAFTGDIIDIYVYEGDDCQSLFEKGSGTLRSLSAEWCVSVTGELVEGSDGITRYELYHEGTVVKPEPVLFVLSGRVNGKEGVTKVSLKENTSEVESKIPAAGSELAEQYLFKKNGEPYAENFSAALTEDKTKLCTQFLKGEGIYFTWESEGGYYQLYQGSEENLIYEGTETSFEFKAGISQSSTFILKASYTQSTAQTRYCYKMLPVTVYDPGIPQEVKCVEDGAKVKFAFTRYNTNTMDYIYMSNGRVLRGKLSLQGDGLYADRLPDGRIAVISTFGTKVFCQIQKKKGEPGFAPVQEIEFCGELITSIQRLLTEASGNALYVAAEVYTDKRVTRCAFYGKWIQGGEKLSMWFELQGNNDMLGMWTRLDNGKLCDSHGRERKIYAYNLADGSKNALCYEGDIAISRTLKDYKSDGDGWLYCRSIETGKGLGLYHIRFQSDKTFWLELIDSQNVFYDVATCLIGKYHFTIRTDECLYYIKENGSGYDATRILYGAIQVSAVKYGSSLPAAVCLDKENNRYLLECQSDFTWKITRY